MGSRALVEEEQIGETVKKISTESFTVPDFIQAFRRSFPDDWERLVERFGLFSSKKRYIVTTYLSNK
jgi:hypothetical protein